MYKRIIISLVVVLVAFGLFFIFKPKAPITIAFTAGLTGDLSSLGIEARNGYELAMDEINANGGIKGHPVQTRILNSESSPSQLSKSYQTLKDEGVQYVIGPLISSMAETVRDEGSDLLIMSPSIASDLLSKIDDYFFRISPPTYLQPKQLIDYLSNENITPSFTIIYDLRNTMYVNEFISYFENNYPGEILNTYAMGADDSMNAEDIVSAIVDDPSEAVLCLCPAIETGSITQYLDVNELDIMKFGVSWSMTADLIEYGGSSIDDMLFIQKTYSGSIPEENPDFVESYEEKFETSPSFISALAYQATMYLAQAMNESDSLNYDDIKKAIVNLDPTILGDPIIMDAYGDRDQAFTMYHYVDDAFVPLD